MSCYTQELSSMLWAFAKTRNEAPSFFESVIGAVLHRISAFSPQVAFWPHPGPHGPRTPRHISGYTFATP